MREFIRLYLCPQRARRLERYALVQNVLCLLTVGGLCLAVVFSDAMGEAGNLVLLILSAVVTLLSALFVALQERFSFQLCDEQHADDLITASQEERERSERYYSRLLALRSGRGKVLGGIRTGAVYLALIAGVVFSLLYQYSVIGNETYLYCLLGDAAVVFLGFVLHIVSAARAELAYSAFRTDMRQEIAFYRERAAASGVHITETTVLQPYEYFLTQELREEYRSAHKRSGLPVIGWIAAFVLVFLTALKNLSPAAQLVIGAVALLLVALMAFKTVRLQMRMNTILRANAQQLPATPEGETMRGLQAAYIRLQKTGNIVFGAAIALAVLLAVVVTVTGCAFGEIASANILENLAGTLFICLLIVGMIVLVIWFAVYARYRCRVKTVEKGLEESTYANAINQDGGGYEGGAGKAQ